MFAFLAERTLQHVWLPSYWVVLPICVGSGQLHEAVQCLAIPMHAVALGCYFIGAGMQYVRTDLVVFQ